MRAQIRRCAWAMHSSPWPASLLMHACSFLRRSVHIRQRRGLLVVRHGVGRLRYLIVRACIAKCRRPGAHAAATLGRALLFVTLTRRPCCFCCSLYNNIRTPGQLQPTATFYLFKEHIEPKWEDPKNTHGGCWTASVPSKGPNSKSQLDAWWLNGVSVWTLGGGTCAGAASKAADRG